MTTDYRTEQEELAEVEMRTLETTDRQTAGRVVESDESVESGDSANRTRTGIPSQRTSTPAGDRRSYRPKAVITATARLLSRSWVVEISVIVALAVAYNVIRALPAPMRSRRSPTHKTSCPSRAPCSAGLSFR